MFTVGQFVVNIVTPRILREYNYRRYTKACVGDGGEPERALDDVFGI